MKMIYYQTQTFPRYIISLYQTIFCIVCFTWIFLLACSDPLAPISCQSKVDCPDNHLCIESTCKKQDSPTPTSGTGSFQCLTNQECESVAECSALGCRCVEGLCFPNECKEGERRSCEAMCGTGEQVCENGVWRACNTQSGNEICGTGEDEDCDGQADENCMGCEEGDERACDNGCGIGTEYCFNNSFRGCTAPRPRLEICGTTDNPIDEDCDGTVDEGCADCTDGEERSCDSGCGETGVETCIENTWRNCTAPTPVNEVCDGVDNDCDGNTDEDITRDCSTVCGTGFEICETGTWKDCTANTMCMCGDLRSDTQVCGICGARQRMCIDDTDQWGEWSECNESGQCVPGESQKSTCGNCGDQRRYCGADCTWTGWQDCQNERSCSPGEEEKMPCTQGCGEQKRVCGDDCLWGDWSSCTNIIQEECTPGEMLTEACGNCGQRTRECSNSCLWEEWGACQSEGECVPAETQDRSCGAGICATETRICNAQCEWDEWGECNEEGSCTPGETQESECGNCGQRIRRCNDSCAWGEWEACQNESSICAPGEEERIECGENNEGECRLGEQSRTCDDECAWSSWSSCVGVVYPSAEVCGNELDEDCNGILERSLDDYDRVSENNTCRTCTFLPSVNPDNLTLSANIDSINDQADYYCFYVDDGFSIWGANIRITLTDVPSNSDLDIFLYHGITTDDLVEDGVISVEEMAYRNCESNIMIDSSTGGRGSSESIEWTERVGWGADDSGLYIIEVRPIGTRSYSCYEDYDLYVHGLR